MADIDFSVNQHKVNALKNFMEEYKKGLEQVKNFNDINNQEEFIPPSIDIKDLQDQELVSDLKQLKHQEKDSLSIINGGQAVDEISTQKTTEDFGRIIGNFLNDVNNNQKDANNAIKTFISGGDIDLHSVMIASERSSLSMQLTMKMRNEALKAYKELSKTPI